jgi:ABC-type phosphate transport system substrate-binding protein
MHKRVKTAVCLGVAGGLGITLSLGSWSFADVQPHGNDIVGVGSDTVQYIGDFVNDGDPNSNAGYNNIERTRRIFSFDATADAGGAAVYGPGGVATVPNIVPRAGGFPLARPNGSGDGIGQLLHDTTAPFTYNYVRSSRLPNATEESTAAGIASFGGGLHVYQIAADFLQVADNNQATGVTAGDPLTCVPAAGLTGANLVNIYKGTYKIWNDIPGYASPGGTCGTEGILPLIPQTGSGTRNDFLADLQNTYNGGTAITLGANVVAVEEHDPRGITSQVSHTDVNGNTVNKQDAISPFSVGRHNLIQTGYFDHTLTIKGGTSPVLANTVALETGGSAYNLNRFLYIIVRQSDVTSPTPFLPGGSQNWVTTFFGSATSWYGKAANAALFTSAGVTQSWVDKGMNP